MPWFEKARVLSATGRREQAPPPTSLGAMELVVDVAQHLAHCGRACEKASTHCERVALEALEVLKAAAPNGT